MSRTFNFRTFTDGLVEAHRQRALASHDDIGVPPDYETAFAVQRHVAEALGDRPVGWKVAIRPEGKARAGALLGQRTHETGSTIVFPSSKVPKLEIEFAVRLKRDIPLGATREAALAAVSDIIVGAELIASRLSDDDGAGFITSFADNMGNGGYVAGTGVPFVQGLVLTGRHCRIMIDGRVAFDGAATHVQDDPLTPFVAYATDPERLGELKAGEIVTTGTLTGQIRLADRPCTVEAAIDGIGALSFRLT